MIWISHLPRIPGMRAHLHPWGAAAFTAATLRLEAPAPPAGGGPLAAFRAVLRTWQRHLERAAAGGSPPPARQRVA